MSRTPATKKPHRTANITFSSTSGGWKVLSPKARVHIRKAVNTALRHAGAFDGPRPALAVVLTDDVGIRELNRDFRGQDKPTNVLSFPSGVEEPEDGELPLGDIILSGETLAREAMTQDKNFDAHLMHLAVHGCLHLLGHDHYEDAEAEAMEALEVAVLQSLGIENPYL